MFEFKGLFRTLSSLVSVVAAIAYTIPAAAPYAEAISIIAGFLGGTGIVRATARQIVK
jgi:hypothetical protein